MLIPLHWMSSLQTLVLLAAGAALLTGLLTQLRRLPARPWLMPALAVVGLWAIAAALDVLKDRVHLGRPEWNNPPFKVVRNAQSLALAGVPLALAALWQPRLARAVMAVLGLVGLGLLFVTLWAGVEFLVRDGPLWISATRFPGAWLLVRDGNLAAGRWLWCLGAALMAVPTGRALMRRRSGPGARKCEGLSWTLLGLGISSLGMGCFFWHSGDVSYRFYTYLIMMFGAYVAPLLALADGRIVTARWAQHALGVLGAVIAVWMLTGVAGANFESGRQHLADYHVAMLLLFLMLLIPPVLTLHLALPPIWRAVMKRLPAPPRGRRAPHPD